MKILITGAAGFIGFHLALLLTKSKKNKVYGIDNLNNYYDIKLKKDRLKILKCNKNFFFEKIDISYKKKLNELFKKNKFDYVVNLAAQAGVRYSINNPNTYFQSNVLGFFNILDCCKEYNIKHLLFASTSSVYGNSNKKSNKEFHNTSEPLSFYAATKKTNEVLAYSYSNIHNISITGMRFFTVYGPFGRPDMALYKFAHNINKNKTIKLFNNGNHNRDFTYIDDVVKAINLLIKKPLRGKIPFRILNIGNSKSISLKKFVNIIEKNIGKKAKKKNVNMQLGDVKSTKSNISLLSSIINYKPKTNIEKGIHIFLKWFDEYYKIK